MAIKLNEKGKLKVAMADVRVVMLPTDPPKYRASKEADALEFEPEDFKDVVLLSVDEAKEIAVTMFAYHKLCQKFLIGDDNFVIKASKVSHNLDKKIEKAEGK